MMRLVAPVLLVTAVGLAVPLAGMHAQSIPATVQHEADRAGAKAKGAWTQARGEMRERWGALTDNDMQEIEGRREVLIGKLQTRYALSYQDAEREVGDFEARRP
jgi:uncharacterized protein YjbJ (UPF0337 family)